jgi:hypothetical protein
MSLSSSTGLSRLLGRGLWTRARRLRERRPRRARFRLAVDLLESRALLSTLTVTNTNDSGKGSLRYEVAQAKAGDTLAFASGLQGKTITLTSGPITINKSLRRRSKITFPIDGIISSAVLSCNSSHHGTCPS